MRQRAATTKNYMCVATSLFPTAWKCKTLKPEHTPSARTCPQTTMAAKVLPVPDEDTRKPVQMIETVTNRKDIALICKASSQSRRFEDAWTSASAVRQLQNGATEQTPLTATTLTKCDCDATNPAEYPLRPTQPPSKDHQTGSKSSIPPLSRLFSRYGTCWRWQWHWRRFAPEWLWLLLQQQLTSLQSQQQHALVCLFNLLLPLLLLLLAQAPHVVEAACRNEPSRPCEIICSANGRNCTVRALLLLPDDDVYVASMRRTLPILYYAEQTVRERQLLPPYIHFEWMAEDVQCDAAYAVIKAMDGIVKNCAHVVFGPVCDYALAAVSRITKYFNSNGTPLISVGGATYNFEKKKTTCADEFYMLLRTGTLSFESISELTIALMRHYNWTHSVFFYERDGQMNVAGEHTCFLMMNSLGMKMRKENLNFAQYPLEPNLTNRTEEMKREIGNKHANQLRRLFHYKIEPLSEFCPVAGNLKLPPYCAVA